MCPRKRQGEVETARSECAVETHTAQLFPMPCGKEVPFRGEAVSGSVAADVGAGEYFFCRRCTLVCRCDLLSRSFGPMAKTKVESRVCISTVTLSDVVGNTP